MVRSINYAHERANDNQVFLRKISTFCPPTKSVASRVTPVICFVTLIFILAFGWTTAMMYAMDEIQAQREAHHEHG